MPVIMLLQIVAILYYILHSTGSQCKSTRRGGDMFSLGSPADKTSSTVHHTMNFVQEFLRNTYQKEITVIDTGQDKRCGKNFCGLSSKELMNRSDSPDLKVCGLANSVDLLLHGEPTVKHDT